MNSAVLQRRENDKAAGAAGRNAPDWQERQESRTGAAAGLPLFLPDGLAQAETPRSGCCAQPKLSIGPVDDPFEREADAVADRVMHPADANGPEGAKSPAVVLQRHIGEDMADPWGHITAQVKVVRGPGN